ncbi:MAG: oligosaccharide flippase family protein, partial [Acetobacteraceae bacterium]
MNQRPIAARAAQGAAWLLSWRVITRLIGLVSMLILVRLLKPADFGVLALGVAMLAAADATSSLGVIGQLIRDDNPDRELFDTAFTVNAIRGVVLATLLLLADRPLASFFGNVELVPVVWAMSAVMLIRSLENVGVAEYQRDLNYSVDFRLSAVPRVLSSTAVITSAFVFRDYRALIVGVLVGNIARTTYSYALHPYRPHLTLRGWRRLFSFSLWVWLTGIQNFFRNRSDSVIIARVLGSTPLGIYAVAQEMATLSYS